MSLSSEYIDAAIICSSKAAEFVSKDDRFALVPDIISNSSVIVVGNPSVKSVGVSEGREYEINMVNDMLGSDYKIIPTSTKALPYLLEKGEVGAIVIDYMNSIHLGGNIVFPDKNQHYNTYSMIISKKFLESKKYKSFKEKYNIAIQLLNKDYNFLENAEKNYNDNYTEDRRKTEWQILNIKMQTLKK